MTFLTIFKSRIVAKTLWIKILFQITKNWLKRQKKSTFNSISIALYTRQDGKTDKKHEKKSAKENIFCLIKPFSPSFAFKSCPNVPYRNLVRDFERICNQLSEHWKYRISQMCKIPRSLYFQVLWKIKVTRMTTVILKHFGVSIFMESFA